MHDVARLFSQVSMYSLFQGMETTHTPAVNPIHVSFLGHMSGVNAVHPTTTVLISTAFLTFLMSEILNNVSWVTMITDQWRWHASKSPMPPVQEASLSSGAGAPVGSIYCTSHLKLKTQCKHGLNPSDQILRFNFV